MILGVYWKLICIKHTKNLQQTKVAGNKIYEIVTL